jgi:prepilin-type N-terminal cleavage/methylation domain-containing protein
MDLTPRPVANRHGFTLMEIVIAVAIVALFAAAISPVVFKHLQDAKITKAMDESKAIAGSILVLNKDTGYWPMTNANGPTGTIDRIVSSANIPAGAGTAAGAGASNWGSYGSTKLLGDFLYNNNPDDDTGATGYDQAAQDYPTTGVNAWRGPYLDRYTFDDPWGHAYVINARYFSGGLYNGTVRHKVFVLSAGPDGKWQTPYSDAESESEVLGDDIGSVVMTR